VNIFLGLPVAADHSELLLNLLLQAHPHWQNHPAIRWSAVGNHHLTMHFFGPIDPDLLSDFAANLDKYIKHGEKFYIIINELYNFPNENSKLIAAHAQLSSPLAELYHQVQRAVQDHGFPVEDRPFLPHITLCRANRRNVLRMDPIILPEHIIPIDQLVLYQTQSTPAGSRYIPLKQWPLVATRQGVA
jgi:RNA 2',3'-cyclic 3'-phosphodiesterase